LQAFAIFQHVVTMRALANNDKAGGWNKSSFAQAQLMLKA